MPQRAGIALFDNIPTIITNVFGEPEDVTLQRAGEAAVTFPAVFDQREVDIEYPDGDGLVRETHIFIFARRDDVGAAKVGDMFTVRGTNWRAVDFLPDGEGAIEVQLSRIDQNTDC